MINKELLAERAQTAQTLAALLPEISQAQSIAEGICPVQWCRDLVIKAREITDGKSVMSRDGLWQLQLMIEGCTKGQSGEEDLAVYQETLDAMELIGDAFTSKVATLLKANLQAYSAEWDLHIRRNRCTALI